MSIPIMLKVKRINAFFGFTALICIACLLVSFFRIPEECLASGSGCFQKFIYRSSAMVRELLSLRSFAFQLHL